MKKQYITPATMAIALRSATQLLTVSNENEYSNNQGHIHFNSTPVRADDGD